MLSLALPAIDRPSVDEPFIDKRSNENGFAEHASAGPIVVMQRSMILTLVAPPSTSMVSAMVTQPRKPVSSRAAGMTGETASSG